MRRILFALFVFFTLQLSMDRKVAAQDKPNIIIFLVDDMGLMDSSVPFLTDEKEDPEVFSLNEWYRTPNMGRLSKEGVRYSDFYANSVCSPSRISLITGQSSARHRTTNWIKSAHNNKTPFGPSEWKWDGLSEDAVTIPQLLRENGYRTMHIGKGHMGAYDSFGEDPLNFGYDLNIAGSAIGHQGSYYGEYGYGNIKGNLNRPVPHLENYYGTHIFLTEALTIEAEREIRNSVEMKQPFFLYMSHYALHGPFDEDDRFMDNYQDDNYPDRAKAFAALVEGMDKSLGDIMNCLDSLGVAENTIVFFLGDNGSSAPLGPTKGHYTSAPLRGRKGSEYEGGVRIPFIASWVKADKNNKFQKDFPIKSNFIQKEIGTLLDIFPTVMNIAKINVPKDLTLDGYDLSTQLKGEIDPHHENSFLMHFPHKHKGKYFTTYREGDWKLIYFYNPKMPDWPFMELYNLKEDPYENENLAAEEIQQLTYLKDRMIQKLKEADALYPEDKNGNILRPR